MGMFGGAPKAPAPPPPMPMPDLLDPAVLAAKKRQREMAMSRSGRASTILSGGDEYSGVTLGSR